MKLAFLYAGQGSQKAGMGKDFYEKYPAFAEVIDKADDSLSFDLKKTMFEDPDGCLSQTAYTQPALAAYAAGVTRLLYEEGIYPEYTAGLSLGEYSALHAAGVFDTDELIRITAKRGGFMTKAGEGMEALMCAVMGYDAEKLEKLCAEVTASGIGKAEISNFNATGQIVISGEVKAVEETAKRAADDGARRTVILNTSGAFHTSFMAPAGEELKKELSKMHFKEMKMPVIFNATGLPIQENENLTDLLVAQIQNPVRMEQTLGFLAERGVDTIIEIGPGKTLSGFVRHTVKGIKTISIDKAEDLEKAFSLCRE